MNQHLDLDLDLDLDQNLDLNLDLDPRNWHDLPATNRDR